MFGYSKQRGFTGIEIAVLVAVMVAVGAITPIITKKADTPIEQLAENVIKMETGQVVDFSATLKKDEQGNVSASNMHAVTKSGTATSNNSGRQVIIPDTYGK